LPLRLEALPLSFSDAAIIKSLLWFEIRDAKRAQLRKAFLLNSTIIKRESVLPGEERIAAFGVEVKMEKGTGFRFCPSCGRELPRGNNAFCPFCGKSLKS